MTNVSNWKKRPIVYSFILSLGFILILFAKYLNQQFFIIGSIILYFVVLLELYFNSNHFHEKIKKNSSKLYEFSHHKSIQFSHHLLIPSLLYFGMIGFAYYNAFPGVYLILVVLCFFLFSLLFENIYAYYHHHFTIHKSTSYVYDLISVFIMYFFVDTFLNLYSNGTIEKNSAWLLFTFITILMSLLLVIRHSVTTETIISVFIFATLVSGFFRILSLSNLSIIQSTIVITSIYAMYNLIITNYSEKKFEMEDILEFGVILLLAISVLNIFSI